jgi:hypothetical protein
MKRLPVEQIGVGSAISSLAAGYAMPSMQIVRSFRFVLFLERKKGLNQRV